MYVFIMPYDLYTYKYQYKTRPTTNTTIITVSGMQKYDLWQFFIKNLKMLHMLHQGNYQTILDLHQVFCKKLCAATGYSCISDWVI